MNYIEVSQEAGKLFYQQYHDKGKIVMLNMLRFKEVADYSEFPNLKPGSPISGKEAYDLYMKYTLPHIKKAGSRIIFLGRCNQFLIGPEEVKWDSVLMVQHESVEKFMAFARDPEYLKTAGHRTAALEDSRLLPMVNEIF